MLLIGCKWRLFKGSIFSLNCGSLKLQNLQKDNIEIFLTNLL